MEEAACCSNRSVPPVAFSSLANRFQVPPVIAFMFSEPSCHPPPPPIPLCWGLPREAEPGCDIVCHCGITALASRHETCRRHGGGDLRCTRSVLPWGCRTLQRGKKQLHRKKKPGEAEAHSFLQDSELSDFLNISDIQSTLLPMVTLR